MVYSSTVELHSESVTETGISSASNTDLETINFTELCCWNRWYPRYQMMLTMCAQHPTTLAPTLHVQYHPVICPSKLYSTKDVCKGLLQWRDRVFTFSGFPDLL